MKIELRNKVLAVLLSVILVSVVATEANAAHAEGPALSDAAVTDAVATHRAITSEPAMQQPIPDLKVTPASPAAVYVTAGVTYAAFSAADAEAVAHARYVRMHTTYGAFTSDIVRTLYLPGTKMLRAQHIRPYLDRTKPMIALTFDDGPSKYTEQILDTLEKYDSRATFCVLGNRVKPYKKQLRLIAASGSQIVGHSWNHAQLTKLTKKKIKRQLKKTNDIIARYTAVTPKLYRPPYGSMNDDVRKVSKKLKLAMLTWSFDSEDWKLLDSEKVYKVVKKDVKENQILLFHDIHKTTAQAMVQVIPWLTEQGYQLVTVDELFYYRGIKVKAGETYNDGVE